MKKAMPTANKNTKKKYKPTFSWAWVYVIILLYLILSPFLSGDNVKEITWQQFSKDMLSRKAVEKLEVINKEHVNVYIKSSFAGDTAFKAAFKPVVGKGLNYGPHYTFTIGSVESFELNLDKAEQGFPLSERVSVKYINKSNWFVNILGWTVPFILMFLIWNFIMRRMAGTGAPGGSSIFSFGKSRATLIEKQNSTVTFADVAGLEEAKVEVSEIVDFLKTPDVFTKLGAKIPKGVILVGPPGTGKTMLAKAVAGEAQVPFFSISGAAFVEMFVGVGASRVRDMFQQAKEKAPCIIFIDEIDAIGRSRGKGAYLGGVNDERESTLNQLLTEMDGFATNAGVIVLAATNRADMLDPALIRAGRFDRHIYLELPNLTERVAIFKVHTKRLTMADTIDIPVLAAQTPGFSGADIANICNEAALIAARRKADSIQNADFSEAIYRIIAGLEKKSKIITPAEKKVIAYHEAGHAVASWLLENVEPLVKVSIIPRGKSLGAALYLPEERQLRNKTAFVEHLCATLAGRAAEELTFGEISSGALDDLEKATKEARSMVMYYGFAEKLGNVSYYDSTGQTDLAIQKPFSESTSKIIDDEIIGLLAQAYQNAKGILAKKKPLLDQLATLLLTKEEIDKGDLEKILGTRSDFFHLPIL
ncbi:ATP-dependent zinc metalloprotease FtsH [Mucilaginibacter sp. Mucisp84]|uniref:ATP-dependent zinc metalloprotease FtsH n=1 Tax=Mucilaginibacter sp. Mucisp84 TaxID=3243058 RepID=UPI0039A5F074